MIQEIPLLLRNNKGISSSFMEPARSKQQKPISRKRRKQQQMMQGADHDHGNVGTMKKHSSDNSGIDKLPDDVLINILSRLSIKEARRASVLAHRWRYMWMYACRTLRFDNKDTVTGNLMDRKNFEFWVKTVVEHHQARYIEGMAICFDAGGGECEPSVVDSWLNFAMRKEVQRFELNLSFKDRYEFPSVERLISLPNGVITSPFCRLRTLRLDHVNIMDHAVHYFLASCPDLEELCIHFSQVTTNLRVVDPPRLRVLEVHRCLNIQCLEVSAVNLVSLSYGGKEKSLKLKSIPNLRELTISDDFCFSFVMKPEDHMSYSIQLEKLVLDFQLMNSKRIIFAPSELPQLCSLKRLEVQVFTAPGRDILYVTTLLEACPQVGEFRVEMFYSPYPTRPEPFPIHQASRNMKSFRRKIKVVEITGYIGCLVDDELVLELMEIGRRSIERVVIDTQSAYYDDPSLESYMATHRSFRMQFGVSHDVGSSTRNQARKKAQDLVSKFPRRIISTVT